MKSYYFVFLDREDSDENPQRSKTYNLRQHHQFCFADGSDDDFQMHPSTSGINRGRPITQTSPDDEICGVETSEDESEPGGTIY